MRVLLSTIGSRGDVQPLVALASRLKALGQEVRLCVPPDFRDWIESLGMPVIPIGPELRSTGKASPSVALPTPEQRRQMIEGTVATQFETIAAAAQGCDVIVGATALQIAAPSVAERMGIPYVFAVYCPNVLPSPHHAPPVLALRGDTAARAPPPRPREPARPKSSSRNITTSTTGPNASTTSASEPRTPPAHRPPPR
jgi:vancomycin aglycone glucosyltransferase